MSDFVWKRGSYRLKKRTGCPSTPIQGQPNLHDDFSYINIMQNVKNFVQKLNYIHDLLLPVSVTQGFKKINFWIEMYHNLTESVENCRKEIK
jgi:hypothetical protein